MAISLVKLLTRETVEKAVRGKNVQSRMIAAQQIGRTIRKVELSAADRDFAEKILALICQDVSDIVRRALSVTLQNSPNLPHKIARRLIQDIDSIAVPILMHSPVITDEDLLLVLRSKAAVKVKAIAQRQKLSEHICKAIISFGDSAAVADLATNDSALIEPDTAAEMARIYADDDLIRDAALSRTDMPPAVVQKLITRSAEHIRKALQSSENLSEQISTDIANRTQQRALLHFVGRDWPEQNLIAYVATLKVQGLLTPDIIMRAAGIGDMRFVQIAMAKLAGISIRKAGLLLFDQGPLGRKALCQRAGLSGAQLEFLQSAVNIYRDFQLAGHALTSQQMQKLMIERITTLPMELPESIEAEFLERLDSLSQISAI